MLLTGQHISLGMHKTDQIIINSKLQYPDIMEHVFICEVDISHINPVVVNKYLEYWLHSQ